MSNKWRKALFGAVVAGTAVAAGALYYTRKKHASDDFDSEDDFEDEDFDLDEDLKPVEREYVSLTPSAPASEESDTDSSEDAEEPSKDVTAEDTAEEL